MRVPVLLKVFISTLVISGTVYGLYHFLTGKTFRVHNVEVSLDNNADSGFLFPIIKDDIEAKLMQLFGKHVWDVDLDRVIKTVEKDLRVKDAKVTRKLPDTIRITILPYTPIAHILGSRGTRVYPLSRSGEVLPSVAVNETVDSVILRGDIFLRDKDVRMLAIELLNSLPDRGALNARSVSEISFDKKKGLQLRLVDSGSEVWMGFENFAHRASQAQRVLDYLIREQMTGRIIDARYQKKVVVKLRNEP